LHMAKEFCTLFCRYYKGTHFQGIIQENLSLFLYHEQDILSNAKVELY